MFMPLWVKGKTFKLGADPIALYSSGLFLKHKGLASMKSQASQSQPYAINVASLACKQRIYRADKCAPVKWKEGRIRFATEANWSSFFINKRPKRGQCSEDEIEQQLQVLRSQKALEYTSFVSASSTRNLGERYAALSAACSRGEQIRDVGGHALVVLDDIRCLVT